MWFYFATLPKSRPVKNKEKNISVIQTFMKFYANLYSLNIFYVNQTKFMLSLISYVCIANAFLVY